MNENPSRLKSGPFDRLYSAAKNDLQKIKEKQTLNESQLALLKEQAAALEKKVTTQPQKDEPFEADSDLLSAAPNFGYGAEIIGKTVLEASDYCNRLTGRYSDASVKELVNLILGRTEMVKAEILKIVLSEKSSQEKHEEMDRQFEEAKDYFESVMYQIK